MSTVEDATALLAAPALVVVAGGPGCGRSTVLRRLGAAFRGPVHAGGGLASLSGVPAFALARALRVRLPAGDPALLAEAVRSRVRAGLLLLDDLQWADAATLAALPAVAAHCRVAVALRTPHRLPAAAVDRLRAAAAGWLAVPPLTRAEATALVARVAPNLSPDATAAVIARAGGAPLAVESLARHAASTPMIKASLTSLERHEGCLDHEEPKDLEYAVAAALADLTRPARTALAALGLLGRPATPALLGGGVDELAAAGLVATVDGAVAPVSPYTAEVAAGLLDPPGRRALHHRLARLVPPREAARHLAAAGDGASAYRLAVAAADHATTTGERADLLLLAADLPGADPAVRRAAADAALACGRPQAAVRALTGDLTPDAAVRRAEALLQAGDVAAARAAAAPVPDDAGPHLVAARDRVLLLTQLADDPSMIKASLKSLELREGRLDHGRGPLAQLAAGTAVTHPGLRAALAAVAAAVRDPGWERALADAGDRWSAWLLVETLAADGRLDEAARTAAGAARACAADLAYGWQTRFLAAELWCAALRGGHADDVLRRAGDLADRTLPAPARGYATAAAALVEADGGLLAPARSRLSGASGADAVLDWVRREAAWLDGQPDRAAAPVTVAAPPLVDGLRRITARWAGHDGAPAGDAWTDPPLVPHPVSATLAAWDGAAGFDRAAAAWRGVAAREEVRCLLAHGLRESDPARAVPPLLAAERLAGDHGLVVLLGRARRALRRHAVRRDPRGPRTGDRLTDRETAVLRLVAAGEPTRRIAGQLGISAETVETHIRASMHKLGARTRTEAAARLGGAGHNELGRDGPAG
ncbi:LuxR C-terminal-related transcriptional regulator [Actinomycetes bacterium KLBMP 9797]